MSTEDTAARNKRVGAVIRRRRQALGWEQRELAERVGVHVNSVQKWESGTHYPGRKLGKLEEVLGIRLDDDSEPEPQIAPEDTEHLVDLIGRTVPNKRTAAILQDLVKAAARGEELPEVPVRSRRRAAPLASPRALPLPRAQARAPAFRSGARLS